MLKMKEPANTMKNSNAVDKKTSAASLEDNSNAHSLVRNSKKV